MNEEGYVYLIKENSSDLRPAYKIGWAKNPFSRLQDLQTGNYRNCEIINVIPGGKSLENYLHTMYEAHNFIERGGTEWFREHKSFLNYFKMNGIITSEQILEFKKNNSNLTIRVDKVSETEFNGQTHDTSTEFGFDMRPWQRNCFETLKNNRSGVINAPTAAGKTFAIAWLNNHYMEQDASLRSIVVVPEQLIGNNFIKDDVLKHPLEDKGFKYIPSLNLCKDEMRDSTKTRQLKNFLETVTSGTPSERTAIVCYATLRNLYREHKELFENVHIVCDEGHHITSGDYDTEEEMDAAQENLSNKSGEIVKAILKDKINNTSVMLVTATFYRHDGAIIVANEHKLPTYQLSYYNLFRETELIKGFRYNFVKSPDNYIEGMRYLLAQPELQKVIIYIPNPVTNLTISSKETPKERKEEDVLEVYRAITGNFELKWEDIPEPDENGVTEIYSGIKILRVLNFVDDDPKLRSIRKNFMEKVQRDDGINLVDYIITLNMMIEGVDWKHAQSEIIVGVKNSLNQLVQMSGRLFRKAPNKEYVYIYNIIPYASDVTRDALNMYLIAFFGALLLEDVCSAPAIKLKSKPLNGAEKKLKKYKAKETLLSDIINDSEYSKLLKNVINDYVEAIVEDSSIKNNEEKAIDLLVNQTLKDSKVPDEFKESFAEHVINRFKRLTAKMKKPNNELVKNVAGEIDILEDEVYGFLEGLSADGNINMFEKLVSVFADVRNGSQQEMRERIDEVIRIKLETGSYPSRDSKIIFHDINLGNWLSSIRSYPNKFCTEYSTSLGYSDMFEIQVNMGDEGKLKQIKEIGEFFNINGYFPRTTKENQKTKNKEYSIAVTYNYLLKIKDKFSKNVIEAGNNVHYLFWEGNGVFGAYKTFTNVLEFTKNNNGKYPTRDSDNKMEKDLAITLKSAKEGKNNPNYQGFLNHSGFIKEVQEKDWDLSNILKNKRGSKNNNVNIRNAELLLKLYKEDSNFVLTHKYTYIDPLTNEKIKLGYWQSSCRKAFNGKGNSQFPLDADKLLNENGKEGILHSQRNNEGKIWKRGLGRGFSFDLNFQLGTNPEEWLKYIEGLSKKEIKEYKIDIEFAKKQSKNKYKNDKAEEWE